MTVKSLLDCPGAAARTKMIRIRSLLWIISGLAILILAGCSSGTHLSGGMPEMDGASLTETSAATAATATVMPEPTSTPTTVVPTATPEPPTATPEPTVTSTATALPPLSVQLDGFEAWCAPLAYSGTQPEGPDAPDYARLMTRQGELYRIPIPAVYCTVVFHFNQPVPVDGSSAQAKVEIRVMDGSSPFIQQPLQVAAGQADTAWTTLIHPYVINPPFWEVTYTMVLQEPGGSPLWSSPVTFAKPLPEPCLFGGLPDPVTLACPLTDPWEIEPWPDVEYPYDRSRLTPEP